jgi:hypothetical protein
VTCIRIVLHVLRVTSRTSSLLISRCRSKLAYILYITQVRVWVCKCASERTPRIYGCACGCVWVKGRREYTRVYIHACVCVCWQEYFLNEQRVPVQEYEASKITRLVIIDVNVSEKRNPKKVSTFLFSKSCIVGRALSVLYSLLDLNSQ